MTRNGNITFDSKLDSFVPVKAENSAVSALLNADDGEIADEDNDSKCQI